MWAEFLRVFRTIIINFKAKRVDVRILRRFSQHSLRILTSVHLAFNS